MVAIKYNGSNFIMVGGYKISKGITEIKDEDFYRLMKVKSFAFRVNERIFEVPYGFPLVKPVQPKKDVEEDADENHAESDAPVEGRLSVKASLKAINASEDVEFLNSIVESDDRKNVTNAAQDRIKYLNSKEKK